MSNRKKNRQGDENMSRGTGRRYNRDDRWFDDDGTVGEGPNGTSSESAPQGQGEYRSSRGAGYGGQSGFGPSGSYGTTGPFGIMEDSGPGGQGHFGQTSYGPSSVSRPNSPCPTCGSTEQPFGRQPGYGRRQNSGFGGGPQGGFGSNPYPSQEGQEVLGGSFGPSGYGASSTMGGRGQTYYPQGQDSGRDRYYGTSSAPRSESIRNRNTGRGPKGYRRADERICEDVNDALSDGTIDASEITVSVQNGEVTLSGTVESREVKFRAEQMAEMCLGVKDVNNQLRISRQTSTVGGSSSSSSGSTPRDDFDEKTGAQRSSSKSSATSGARG